MNNNFLKSSLISYPSPSSVLDENDFYKTAYAFMSKDKFVNKQSTASIKKRSRKMAYKSKSKRKSPRRKMASKSKSKSKRKSPRRKMASKSKSKSKRKSPRRKMASKSKSKRKSPRRKMASKSKRSRKMSFKTKSKSTKKSVGKVKIISVDEKKKKKKSKELTRSLGKKINMPIKGTPEYDYKKKLDYIKKRYKGLPNVIKEENEAAYDKYMWEVTLYNDLRGIKPKIKIKKAKY